MPPRMGRDGMLRLWVFIAVREKRFLSERRFGRERMDMSYLLRLGEVRPDGSPGG